MLEEFFSSVLSSNAEGAAITFTQFIVCLASALVIGFIIALVTTYKSRHTKSFAVTLALLPAIVCVIIMMVNGNIGAGVAVAGAFSLVRFRSAAGSAKEICAIFLAMAAGLATGMGYIAFAFLFAAILSVILLILSATGFGETSGDVNKTIRITIPEDLDYADVFEDLFREYTSSHRLMAVKTSNMGSLYKLRYDVRLKDVKKEKEFMDLLRCRNGNLEISSSIQDTSKAEL